MQWLCTWIEVLRICIHGGGVVVSIMYMWVLCVGVCEHEMMTKCVCLMQSAWELAALPYWMLSVNSNRNYRFKPSIGKSLAHSLGRLNFHLVANTLLPILFTLYRQYISLTWKKSFRHSSMHPSWRIWWNNKSQSKSADGIVLLSKLLEHPDHLNHELKIMSNCGNCSLNMRWKHLGQHVFLIVLAAG